MGDNWREFAVLFAGSLLLFGSVLGIVVTVEHDRHCGLAEVRDSPQGESVEYYYSELTADQQRLFDRMVKDDDRRFEDEACFGGTVRHEDRYYLVDDGRSIVWANPTMLVPLGGLVGGIGVFVAVFRREMGSRPL